MSAFDPPEPFDALIFDCDGTLADTAHIHFEGLRRGFESAGIEITEAWYRKRVGVSRREFFEEVRLSFDMEVDEEGVMAAHERHFQASVHTVAPIEAIVQVVRKYAGTLPMAVASGGRRPQVEATLHATGLSKYFDAVVTVEDVANGKPAPDLFIEAARLLRVDPDRCVVYEDSEEGVLAARRAGMRCVLVRDE